MDKENAEEYYEDFTRRLARFYCIPNLTVSLEKIFSRESEYKNYDYFFVFEINKKEIARFNVIEYEKATKRTSRMFFVEWIHDKLFSEWFWE